MLKISAAALTIALGLAGHAAAQDVEDRLWSLQMIGADEAAARGFTGRGVTVGVMDSGIQTDHPDLIANLSEISFDAFTNGPVTGDPNGHGTHVAGIIAAARNNQFTRGVAYDARIAPLQLPNGGTLEVMDQVVGASYAYALAEGVRIFNNSWGWDFYIGTPLAQPVIDQGFVFQMPAFRAAVEADSVIVFSTGNESQANPNVQAGLPYYVPEFQPHWLAVTSVGPTGLISSFANRCGLAAQWCLAAPGGEIPGPGQTTWETFVVSSATDGTIRPDAGTSMAAPHVTGGVAIARQMYPGARAADLTRLVLTTAKDIGDPGVDEIYGWGLLNVGNLARTRDSYAASTFANGLWSGHEVQTLVMGAVAHRSQDGGARGGWLVAAGRRGEHDASIDGPRTETDSLALIGGFDLLDRDGASLGVALARAETEFEEAGGRNNGEVETTTLAAYGGLTSGPAFLEASLGFDLRDYRFRRRAVAGTEGTVLEDSLDGRAEADGYGAFAAARVGLALQAGGLTMRPYFHARASRQQIDGFEEQGADIYSLSADGQTSDVHEFGPGFQVAMPRYAFGANTLSADIDVRHGFMGGDDDFSLDTGLLGATITGRTGRLGDATTVSAGAALTLGERMDFTLRGVWSDADRAEAKGVSAGFRLVF